MKYSNGFIDKMIGIILLICTIGISGAIVADDFWHNATLELEMALHVKFNFNRAKNVILFIGDGMGPNTVTASRIMKNGEAHLLSFEKFPHIGLIKTYSVDKQVPDSASTATALYSGTKTNYRTVGVSSKVPNKQCKPALDKTTHLENIFGWAQAAGLKTGFVTTTRVTHATPAPVYAHCPERDWECNAKIPNDMRLLGCKDIGWQLMNNDRGRKLNVIMGGGLQCLDSSAVAKPNDPFDNWACRRNDGLNLTDVWKSDKKRQSLQHAFVQTNRDLKSIDPNTEYILGIFSNSHLPYEYKRDKSDNGSPSLQQMTETTLQSLNHNSKGFVLMVEGGLIDFAHHRGHARIALEEALEFDRTVEWTMNWLSKLQILEETLVIVTADHAHSLMINGYPNRGNNILGIAQNSKMDGVPFTTLTYGTGGPNNYQFSREEEVGLRRDPSKNDTTDYGYSQQSTILTEEVQHGGSDVVVYSQGPMSHLFHNVHEQSYIAHVIAYSAKIGPYRNAAPSFYGIATIIFSIGSTFLAIRLLS
ncbi:alkaline phosphatase isoform X1 [Nilaparvata lugens]|uniref:alkaline phosphatase isoform X1 n=1 Tax=Nilaparvata lugens TaxID=108931 RepID=UPI00193D2275|nr:alkaline phosphatase isoform X1 [Nilaparvata lugens]